MRQFHPVIRNRKGLAIRIGDRWYLLVNDGGTLKRIATPPLASRVIHRIRRFVRR